MQLKYNKFIRNNIVTVELETMNFTIRELTALKKFGEPVIRFEELYNTTFTVVFERRIKTGFKLEVRFDGSKDLEQAADAANQFFEQVKVVLEGTMDGLMDKLTAAELNFESKQGVVVITEH